MPHALEGGDDGKEVIEWGAFPLPIIILLVGPAAAEKRVWRLGVSTPGGWAESSVPQAMVPELAAFGADHDQRT